MRLSSILPVLLAGAASASCATDLKICNLRVADHIAYQDPVCPNDDKTIKAVVDEAFKVFCDSANTGKEVRNVKAPTLYECMEECDEDINCSSGDWYPASNTCSMKGQDGAAQGKIQSKPGAQAFYYVGRLSN